MYKMKIYKLINQLFAQLLDSRLRPLHTMQR